MLGSRATRRSTLAPSKQLRSACARLPKPRRGEVRWPVADNKGPINIRIRVWYLVYSNIVYIYIYYIVHGVKYILHET